MIKENLAVVLTKQKSKLKILNINFNNIPYGYVLIKMKYSGLCHTQLNEINGALGRDKFLPHCMGHEGVGIVLKSGPGVKNFSKGDKVVVSWIKKNFSKKYKPLNYFYKNVIINSGGCNTLSEYALVSDNRLYKMNNLNKYMRESIFLGCALPTASNAILQIPKLNINNKILIMGMGGLGYACYFVLNYFKYKNICCIDSNNNRLKNLVKFNNCDPQKVNSNNIKKFIKSNFEKFDLIIDCTGSRKLIEDSLKLCKKFTGKIIVIGNTKLNEKIKIKTWDIISGKALMGAWSNGLPKIQNFQLNEKILINQIKYIKKILPRKNFHISKINSAIKEFSKGKVLRPIFKF